MVQVNFTKLQVNTKLEIGKHTDLTYYPFLYNNLGRLLLFTAGSQKILHRIITTRKQLKLF